MRHLLTIFFSVILTLITMHFLYPIKNAARAEKDVYQKIMDKGVLRCGYASWEPMLIIDPNTKKLSGISYDIMEEVGKKLNLKIEWKEETSWGDYPQGLKDDRFDVMCVAGTPNAARARVVNFTVPIVFSPVNVWVRSDDQRFDENVTKLNDPVFKMVYKDGTTAQAITLETFPRSSHYGLPDIAPFSNVLLDVSTGKADAAVFDKASANRFIKNNPTRIKAVQNIQIRALPHVFAVKMGEYELQQMLNAVLYELSDVGFIDAVVQKYEPLPNTYYRTTPGYTK